MASRRLAGDQDGITEMGVLLFSQTIRQSARRNDNIVIGEHLVLWHVANQSAILDQAFG